MSVTQTTTHFTNSSSPNSRTTTTRTVTRRTNRSRRRNNRGRNNNRSSTLPAARTFTFRGPRFRRIRSRRQEQKVVLTGYDLVTAIPMVPPSYADIGGTFCCIPANPAYWTGTRISGIARVYQLYRPLKFVVKYVPSVPVTIPGQVVYGTEWATSIPTTTRQQSLATSNGGGITTVYQGTTSNVCCSTSYLPQKNYNVAGDFTDQSVNPFQFRAMFVGDSSALTVSPGYFILYWTYEFTNAIGDTNRQFVAVTSSTDSAVSAVLAQSNLKAIEWGVVIGVLKQVAFTVLRHVAIYLLDTVLAHLRQGDANDIIDEEVNISSGSLLTYQTGKQTFNGQSIVTQNGVDYEIPDDTPVYIYMNGQTIKRTGGPSESANFLTDIIGINGNYAWGPGYTPSSQITNWNLKFPSTIGNHVVVFSNSTPGSLGTMYKTLKMSYDGSDVNNYYAIGVTDKGIQWSYKLTPTSAGEVNTTLPINFYIKFPDPKLQETATGNGEASLQFDPIISNVNPFNNYDSYEELPDLNSYEDNLRSKV